MTTTAQLVPPTQPALGVEPVLTAQPVMSLARRTGVEVELLAPPGRDRRALAEAVARRAGGSVRRTFHTDSEPSLVPGMGHFWHLTPGFEARDADGALLAAFVDDITLVGPGGGRPGGAPPPPPPPPPPAAAPRAPPAPAHPAGGPAHEEWYRLLCDEPRLLRLVADHSDAEAPLGEALEGVAALFGAPVETIGTARRLRDRAGATVALAAPLTPGRERPCEVITPPLVRDHEAALEALLAPARELGFTVPVEAAVHLHVDAGPFRSVGAFANLVRLFGHWREHLRAALGTNPACTRLQPLPAALVDLADRAWSRPDATAAAGAQEWAALQAAAAATGVTKYYDVNLTGLLADAPRRDTVEVRILPGALRGSDITARAALVEALLDRCEQPRPLPVPRGTTSSCARAASQLLVVPRSS